MNRLVWQNPAALVALVGLLVPLLIHLLDRGSSRRIDFAPLHLLQELPRASLRRLRLRERWLWLVRSLLVAVAALMLAGPATLPPQHEAAAWMLIQPGLESSAADAAEDLAADWQMPIEEIERRWLAPGLAPVSAPALAESGAGLWGALLEADAHLAQGVRLAVLAAPAANQLGPVRPRLSREVEWIQGAGGESRSAAVDSGRVRRVYVGAAASRAALLPYLEAVVVAWREGLDARVATVAVPGDAEWIVFAADGDPPSAVLAAVDDGAIWISDSPEIAVSATAAGGVERVVAGAGLILRQPSAWITDPSGSPDPALPVRLWNDLIRARLEPVPPGLFVPADQGRPAVGAAPRTLPPRPLVDALGILLLLLLALERWLSRRHAAMRP